MEDLMLEKVMGLMKTKNVSTYKLLRDTNLPSCLIANWKKRGTRPKAEKIFKLASYFNVPMEYFYSDEPLERYMNKAQEKSVDIKKLAKDFKNKMPSDRALAAAVAFDKLTADEQSSIVKIIDLFLSNRSRENG